MNPRLKLVTLTLFATIVSSTAASAQQGGDPAAVARQTTPAKPVQVPPRTISDITALLDRYQPDPAAVAAKRAEAMREPTQGTSGSALARFYWERAQAAYDLGDGERSVADLRRAYEIERGSRSHAEYRVLYDLQIAENQYGDPVRSAAFFTEVHSLIGGRQGRALVLDVDRLEREIIYGNLPEARSILSGLDRQLEARRRAPEDWRLWGHSYMSAYHRARAAVFQAEGRLVAAESEHRSAIASWESFLEINPRTIEGFSPVRRNLVGSRISRENGLIRNLSLQGRLHEAEMVVRDLLARILQLTGRDSVESARVVIGFARILTEQGRYADAEAMARAALDILARLGTPDRSQLVVSARRVLGSSLVYQSRWKEAAETYDRMLVSTTDDPAMLRLYGGRDTDWAIALIRSGRASEAAFVLRGMLKRTLGRLGNDHYLSGEQRGLLALALAETGARGRALEEFREAVRVLLVSGGISTDESDALSLRTRRLRMILEAYVELLLDPRTGPDLPAGFDAAAEAFRIADAARGGQVQGALNAAAARAAAATPALAALVRSEQDGRVQLAILYATLLRVLNAPAELQVPQVVTQLRARIAELEKAQQTGNAELQKRFPEYAGLIRPRPATLEQARSALREGEVLVSLLTTDDRTYVWAVSKDGATLHHVAPVGARELERSVTALRRALDPGGLDVARWPEFDLAQAGRLYDVLLKPVEEAWRGARNLMIVSNGALAQLPFAVLPVRTAVTEPVAGLRFEHYRSAPWLVREVAITQLPSVNTLVTLRNQPPADPRRVAFAGFGDPQFGAMQATAPAPTQVSMRNLDIRRVTQAGLRDGSAPAGHIAYSDLPPLPDTREEILSIAAALKADVGRDVFLGAAASRQSVRGAGLANRRIVAFATHGLVPGDLPNLDQPALALAAPDGRADAGLLTLEDVLQLKLDADWVVLSACNTAAGDGAGAEAISGLGRGFFYAGSRALLVTHWPVETRSARGLVTRLFERYADDGALTRAEALRQAQLSMLDQAATGADGKPVFSYAHPLFWAAYAVVGDGGR